MSGELSFLDKGKIAQKRQFSADVKYVNLLECKMFFKKLYLKNFVRAKFVSVPSFEFFNICRLIGAKDLESWTRRF